MSRVELNIQIASDFLTNTGLKNFEIKKIAGDASFRSYYRIFTSDQNFILMFAPPSYEDIRPFVKIDELLILDKISAPQIFARDDENGFLLLEDFGDDSYSKVLASNATLELELYQQACDCLLQVHKIAVPKDLPIYNHALLFREVMLLVDWYLPLQNKSMSLQEKALFKSLWFELFDLLSKESQVLVLRDYHADNLMVLHNRLGYQRVGLLDFQDAVIGSNAYDLVSLLEDARRDVDENNRQKIFGYFLQKSGYSPLTFQTDYDILSLQRNIKIIGIFARLAVRDGKESYLKLMPRVLKFIELRLNSNNPILSRISDFFKKFEL